MSKQPSLEEIKDMTVSVKYIVADIPPEEGLMRLSYYVSIPERPGKIYFGWSFRTEENSVQLKNMASEGKIIAINPPIKLHYDFDLFVNENGELVVAKGAEPWKKEGKLIYPAPPEFKKSVRRLNKALQNSKLFEIQRYNKIIHESATI